MEQLSRWRNYVSRWRNYVSRWRNYVSRWRNYVSRWRNYVSRWRNYVGTALTVISFVLLVPGLTLPMFYLHVEGAVLSTAVNIEGDIIDTSRSILGTVDALWQDDRLLVATLIFLFSVLVPVLKGLLLLAAQCLKKPTLQWRLYSVVNSIGKWSMADVFVVALLLTYLSTTGYVQVASETIAVFGLQIPLKFSLLMTSDLLEGFYYFLGYCLMALASLHVFTFKNPKLIAQKSDLASDCRSHD